MFYDLASNQSSLPMYQASTLRRTGDPIVNVRFDQHFLSYQSPQVESHGGIVCFTQGRCGGKWNIVFFIGPVWSRRYCIERIHKMFTVCKGIAVDKGPASLVCFHVTEGLEGSAIAWVYPVYTSREPGTE